MQQTLMVIAFIVVFLVLLVVGLMLWAMFLACSTPRPPRDRLQGLIAQHRISAEICRRNEEWRRAQHHEDVATHLTKQLQEEETNE
jgi:hypothetical protein